MIDPTLLHNPLSIPLIETPKWIIDGMETARRVWVILSYKPVNKISLTTSDDEFMRFLMGDEGI